MNRPLRDREYIERIQGKSGPPQERLVKIIRNGILLRFSKKELAHLSIGTALVTGVGMSLFDYRFNWEFLAVFISAFVIHELAHKFLAQIYNAWAEFRVELYGGIITLISALPFFPFKFIGPGAVYIGGQLSRGRSGRVSLIGPLTNLAMGFGFLGFHSLSAALSTDIPLQILLVGARFNGWIALFNMIPFMGLDGAKIFGWNKLIWGLTLAGSVGLFLIADISSGSGFLRFLRGFF